MLSSVTVTLITFLGSFFLGLTAVFLKKAHVDNLYYALIIRSLASVPLVFLTTVIIIGPEFIRYFADLPILIGTTAGALTLLAADMLIMSILKRKPVGLIAPLMAIFPLFSTTLLLITGYAIFSLPILVFTIIIIIGVAIVTYNPQLNSDQRLSAFDLEAIVYGLLIALFLGITNFIDAIILQTTPLDGLAYTSMKFFLLLVLSITAFLIAGNDHGDWKQFRKNSTSTRYLIAAGISAWGFGSVFIYTGYDLGDSTIVNAIIGTNPIFAVIISFLLGMERLSLLKVLGLFLCVIASIGIVNV